MEYNIMDFWIKSSIDNDISVVTVSIVFKRRVEYHVTTAFLQTLMLVIPF